LLQFQLRDLDLAIEELAGHLQLPFSGIEIVDCFRDDSSIALDIGPGSKDFLLRHAALSISILHKFE